MGPGGAAIAGVLIAIVVAKYTNRTMAGTFIFILSIIGVIMMLAIPSENYGARYGGYVLALQCGFNTLPRRYSILGANTSLTSPQLYSVSHGVDDRRNEWLYQEIRI
jgi:hypothetical protein